jgi:hypothetical protein
MSDLAIMFDETYDAPLAETASRLSAIAIQFKVRYENVVEAYYNYIDSDMFYAQRGM